MNNPVADVTVAISTLDRPEPLARCLDALLSGNAAPAEIVIVDQSRDDRTRCVVERFQERRKTIFYIHHGGRGLGASQNIAFARARGSVVAVTDDDCIPAPGWVAAIERTFAGSGGVDVLTGPVFPLGPDEPGRHPVASRTSMERAVFGPRAMPWDIGSGNNFAARREWLLRAGGNDERLGPGSPGKGAVDMDLFYRLLRAGARIHYEPEALVYHERASRAGRIARREPYGYGMGALCSIWLLKRDLNALRILFKWLFMRGRRLLGGLGQGQWMLIHEEGLVLKGTLGGFFYGLSVRDPD